MCSTIARQQNEALYHNQSGWVVTKFTDEHKKHILGLIPEAIQAQALDQETFLGMLEDQCDYLCSNTIPYHNDPTKLDIKKVLLSDVKNFQNNLVRKAKSLIDLFEKTPIEHKDAIENLYHITYSQDIDFSNLIKDYDDFNTKIHLISCIDINTSDDKKHDYFLVFIENIVQIYYNFTGKWPPKTTSSDKDKSMVCGNSFQTLCEYLAVDIVGLHKSAVKTDYVYKKIIKNLQEQEKIS